jgi:hypothetical protein
MKPVPGAMVKPMTRNMVWALGAALAVCCVFGFIGEMVDTETAEGGSSRGYPERLATGFKDSDAPMLLSTQQMSRSYRQGASRNWGRESALRDSVVTASASMPMAEPRMPVSTASREKVIDPLTGDELSTMIAKTGGLTLTVANVSLALEQMEAEVGAAS